VTQFVVEGVEPLVVVRRCCREILRRHLRRLVVAVSREQRVWHRHSLGLEPRSEEQRLGWCSFGLAARSDEQRRNLEERGLQLLVTSHPKYRHMLNLRFAFGYILQWIMISSGSKKNSSRECGRLYLLGNRNFRMLRIFWMKGRWRICGLYIFRRSGTSPANGAGIILKDAS